LRNAQVAGFSNKSEQGFDISPGLFHGPRVMMKFQSYMNKKP